MARFPPFALAVGLLARYAESTSTECVSYGMDFQNGGSYFQNSLSSDDFTFVSRFDGTYAVGTKFAQVTESC